MNNKRIIDVLMIVFMLSMTSGLIPYMPWVSITYQVIMWLLIVLILVAVQFWLYISSKKPDLIERKAKKTTQNNLIIPILHTIIIFLLQAYVLLVFYIVAIFIVKYFIYSLNKVKGK